MAQAGTNIVTKLRKAILNICDYPRGVRRMCHIMEYLIPRVEEGSEYLKIIGNVLDEYLYNLALNYFDSEAPFQLDDIWMSGSYSEGMQKIDFKELTTSDVDFMIILKNIKVTVEDQVKGNLLVKETTPFVNLYLTDADLIEMWSDFLETSSETSNDVRRKLLAKKLKERFREKYISYGPMFTPLSNETVENVDEGPSIATSSLLPGNPEIINAPIMHFSTAEYDFVLAIKCEEWPLCAQEWISRPRCWPAPDLVDAIIKGGFHIVCKSSPEGDFRLSYTDAEILLIQNLSNLQHKTYRAFKSFVGHFKSQWMLNGKKSVCSYHLKTIVLWYCEKSDPTEWTENQIVAHLLSLIDDLILALKTRNLPMYFMPKYNLMENMEDNTEIVEKIVQLRSNLPLIAEAIIAEEPDILEFAHFLLNSVLPGSFQPLIKGIEKQKFDPSDFLQSIETMMDKYDKSWTACPGKELPKRFLSQAQKSFKAVYEPAEKLIIQLCNSMNVEYFSESLKDGDTNKDN